MNLHEYQAKQLLKKYNLPVPQGYVCYSIDNIKKTIALNALQSQCKWMVKCQIHAGGRSRAGGIFCSDDPEKIIEFASRWFGRRLITDQTTKQGLPVNVILLEKAVDIVKEFYLGVIVERSSQSIIVIASTAGGVNIEHTAVSNPQCIHRITLDPLTGSSNEQGLELALRLGCKDKEITQFLTIFRQFTDLFMSNDVLLAEINPLIINQQGNFVCLDAKLIIDDSALYRRPALSLMRDFTQEDEREYLAAKQGFSYVSLNGSIGCLVNGAGLAMATMDMINLYGGKPANFLDIGGNTTREKVKGAFKLILSDRKVKSILVNIFGGIVRCDFIAEGIIAAIKDMDLTVPIVVRLEGNQVQLAQQILSANKLNIMIANGLTDAIEKITRSTMSS